VRRTPVLLLDLIDHLFSFTHDQRYPPFESGFVVNLIHYCILCQLNGVAVLDVLQRYPISGPVGELDL